MIRYDSEGLPRRSFRPHLALLALAAAAALVDRLSGGDWTARTLAAAVEPVNLLLAGILGWWVLSHRQLLPLLLCLGLIIGYGLTAVDFEAPGGTAPTELVVVRLLACVLTGYLANAARLLLSPPPPKI